MTVGQSVNQRLDALAAELGKLRTDINTGSADRPTGTIVKIDSDEVGVQVDRHPDGGLYVSVDSRDGCIANLTADAETSVRLGDLYHAAVALLGGAVSTPTTREYARGMAELIGNFAPEGDQFDSEHMREALLKELEGNHH